MLFLENGTVFYCVPLEKSSQRGMLGKTEGEHSIYTNNQDGYKIHPSILKITNIWQSIRSMAIFKPTTESMGWDPVLVGITVPKKTFTSN